MKSTAQPLTISSAGFEQIIEATKHEIADRVLSGTDIDELNTIDLQTCAGFLGIPLDRVTKVLPFIELGPRSRRVTIADYKAYLAAHKKYPTGWKPKDKSAATPTLTVVTP